MICRDRGAADALGLVLIAPASIGLALLVVALGRHVDSTAQVRTAAEAAAQAAALERDPQSAVGAAQRVASEMLIDADSCAQPMVTVDTARFHPGGHVAVEVRCVATDRGVAPVRVGGVPVSARAVAALDRFRAGSQVP